MSKITLSEATFALLAKRFELLKRRNAKNAPASVDELVDRYVAERLKPRYRDPDPPITEKEIELVQMMRSDPRIDAEAKKPIVDDSDPQ